MKGRYKVRWVGTAYKDQTQQAVYSNYGSLVYIEAHTLIGYIN